MNSQRNLGTVVRILFAVVVLAAALLLLSKARSDPAAAKLTQTPAATRRLLEMRVHEKAPIRVKIKREKEKRVRDLDNENWARDLELEVKNIGDKPIYYLYFQLHVPEAKIQNGYQNFSIVYGRVALSKWDEKVTSEDVTIKPGETIILKLEENDLRGWDQARDFGFVPKHIRGIRLVFLDLNFGDGTGFDGGTPWPRSGTIKPISDLHPPNVSDSSRLVPLDYGRLVDKNTDGREDAGLIQPASFVSKDPVKGLSIASARNEAPDPDCNCVNSSCRHGTKYTINTSEANVSCYQCGEVTRLIIPIVLTQVAVISSKLVLSGASARALRLLAKTITCPTAQ
ncbi:MAG: hypothetical protein ACXW18_04150 [Pyrinomonadaceae bacterium]